MLEFINNLNQVYCLPGFRALGAPLEVEDNGETPLQMLDKIILPSDEIVSTSGIVFRNRLSSAVFPHLNETRPRDTLRMLQIGTIHFIYINDLIVLADQLNNQGNIVVPMFNVEWSFPNFEISDYTILTVAALSNLDTEECMLLKSGGVIDLGAGEEMPLCLLLHRLGVPMCVGVEKKIDVPNASSAILDPEMAKYYDARRIALVQGDVNDPNFDIQRMWSETEKVKILIEIDPAIKETLANPRSIIVNIGPHAIYGTQTHINALVSAIKSPSVELIIGGGYYLPSDDEIFHIDEILEGLAPIIASLSLNVRNETNKLIDRYEREMNIPTSERISMERRVSIEKLLHMISIDQNGTTNLVSCLQESDIVTKLYFRELIQLEFPGSGALIDVFLQELLKKELKDGTQEAIHLLQNNFEKIQFVRAPDGKATIVASKRVKSKIA